MGLNTENAGALVGGGNPDAGVTHTVEVLVGTFVKSVGRDVRVGETVTISNDDYRFLKPYRYVKDVEGDVEAVEVETTGNEGDETKNDGGKAVDEGKAPKIEGKRK